VDVPGLLAELRLCGSVGAPERLLAIYYDTDELALWRHGYSLSTRRVGGAWVQAVNSDGRECLQHPETVQEIESRAVDRSKLPAHGRFGKQLAKLLAKRAVQPIFEVELQRSEWGCVLAHGTRVAVTLDQGEIRSAGGLEPVHVVELRLAEGALSDFYAWVLTLAQHRALPWETIDPVTRGYELAAATPVMHHKAIAIVLADDSSGEDAFTAIVHACLLQLRLNLAATRAGQSEGVHQMRVALRRLRSCLKVFRPLIPREASVNLLEDLRWLNGVLGPARDWDVFMEEGMAPVFARFADRRGLQSLQRHADAIRQARRQALYQGLAEPRYHRLILRLQGWLACRDWRQSLSAAQQEALTRPVVEFATQLLTRDHRRVVKRGADFIRFGREERHTLRIRIKQLRYALEFFASLYPGPTVDAYVKAAASLQDSLGALNDAAVAERLLDEAGLGRATPTRHLIEGWYACNVHLHERQFMDLWRGFMTCKPAWQAD